MGNKVADIELFVKGHKISVFVSTIVDQEECLMLWTILKDFCFVLLKQTNKIVISNVVLVGFWF